MIGKSLTMVGLALIASLSGCGSPCSSELIGSEQSQDGKTEASFFKKNCGATTGYVYELKVGDVTDKPSSRNLVLRFDNDHQIDWPENDSTLINLRWVSDSTLDVSLTQRVRVFKEENASGDTVVRYRFKPGTSHL